jgi:hypothetical protein
MEICLGHLKPQYDEETFVVDCPEDSVGKVTIYHVDKFGERTPVLYVFDAGGYLKLQEV